MWELTLIFHHGGSGDQTQVARRGGKPPYSTEPSHWPQHRGSFCLCHTNVLSNSRGYCTHAGLAVFRGNVVESVRGPALARGLPALSWTTCRWDLKETPSVEQGGQAPVLIV